MMKSFFNVVLREYTVMSFFLTLSSALEEPFNKIAAIERICPPVL
jgi:hypothetical protein